MNVLPKLGIYEYQRIPHSMSNHRTLDASYFKVKKGSIATKRLNTRIVDLKGVEFDLLKI